MSGGVAEPNSPNGGSRNPSDAQVEQDFRHQALQGGADAHPRFGLREVHFRLGRRFIAVWWLLPALVMGAVLFIVAAKIFIGTGAGRSFINAHRCVQSRPRFAPGISAWVIITHAANFFFMVMIVRAGWQILADHPRLYLKVHSTPGREWLRFRGPVPEDRVWTAKDDAIMLSPLFGMPGGRHTIGVARHWHFIFDILFVVNGVVFIVFTFVTDHYLKLVPTQLSILPAAGSCVVQYAALHLPAAPGGYFRFDALQQLSYFVIVFVFGPLAILTGLAMSPALDNRFKGYQRLFGNRQFARSLHFLVMVVFVGFFAVHVLIVAATGFSKNLEGITLGLDRSTTLDGVALFLLALALTAAFNIWAIRFSWTHTRVLQRISNATVGRGMDLLFDHYAPRAEYSEEDISPYFWPNGLVPTSDEWKALKDGDWRDYRLKVSGLVEHPLELSLEDIKAMAKQDQITMHNCIQGWSAIGKWGGLPFADLIELAKPQPEAQWAMFYSFGEGGEGGEYYDSHSMHDLRHPQSLLAYEMNGEPLPILHGSPLRLRVENQLGFKHVKWIREIEFVHDFRDYGLGQGGYNEDHEFYGYRDEI